MIQIINSDITVLEVDAIVNAANEHLQAGGGVCGAIFRAAGYEELQKACGAYGRIATGEAVITPGFNLKAKYVIHAVGPVYFDGEHNEPKLLRKAYTSALTLARDNGCASIAFPLISAGIYGYPHKDAWDIALKAVKDFLAGYEMNVYFAVVDAGLQALGEERLKESEA